ncbi:hypothetical protein [Spiroplasma endosymbiont of Dasysyrphus albostriatus]|uniref:hypothetical protein n=1 Tax=Spiroplasma endosymbiont of Dasysyrphus albostriatus TaxID=3066299 RepID=UPI0030CFE98D
MFFKIWVNITLVSYRSERVNKLPPIIFPKQVDNINLLPNNPHGIKWKITKDGGCIIFPSNQQIDFIGYANGNKIFGKEAGGSSFLGSRTDEIIMAEEKETLTEKQLTYRYERLQNSMFRSNRIKVSKEPIKEWSWTFIDKYI